MPKWGEGGGTWAKARDMVASGKTTAEFKEALAAAPNGALSGPSFDLRAVREANVSGRAAFVFDCADGRLFSVNREGTAIGAQIVRSGVPPAGRYHLEASINPSSPVGYQIVLKAD
jgi:hypothetical protein